MANGGIVDFSVHWPLQQKRKNNCHNCDESTPLQLSYGLNEAVLEACDERWGNLKLKATINVRRQKTQGHEHLRARADRLRDSESVAVTVQVGS